MKEKIVFLFMLFNYTISFAQVINDKFDIIMNSYSFFKDNNYLIGKEINNFEAVSLNNDTVSKSCLFGKVTLINFWFENCAPCIAEFGVLSNLYKKYKNNCSFQFLSFTPDESEIARKVVNKYSIPFAVFPVSREFIYRMNFNSGFPTTIIINKEGIIEFIKVGGSIDDELIKQSIIKIDDIIEQILARN